MCRVVEGELQQGMRTGSVEGEECVLLEAVERDQAAVCTQGRLR